MLNTAASVAISYNSKGTIITEEILEVVVAQESVIIVKKDSVLIFGINNLDIPCQ